MLRQLRPHQTRALDMLRASLGSGRRRPMLQAPTGFGKTVIGAAIVEGALAKGKRVLFVVPALSLVDQTVQSFWAEGIRDVGVMQGAHALTRPDARIQVASVQTLQRRRLPEADVVVVDEAHRWFEFYGSWMAREDWLRVPFIGLSATPWTKGLGKHYDDLLIAATTADLIEAGYLSPFRVFAPSHPDLSGVRTQAGDYHEGDLGEAMNRPELVADVVGTWKQRGEDRPTLCFGVDRAHAKHLQAQFEAAGISCGYVDAYTDPEERERVRKAFHAGAMRVVCNVGCLTTGVDWDVRCIILARPTRSEMLFVQIIGRGLRTAEGKADCLVLDHSDTHLRLGFVTDIHRETLDEGRERAKAERASPLPKECPTCSYLKPPKLSACPNCGFKPERQCSVEAGDGELVEVVPRASKLDMVEKRIFFAQLKGYAAERGYSDGWAAHKYREKTGVWPQGVKDTPAITPTPEVRSWIKSRQIAWAKSQGAVHAGAL